MAQEAYFGAVVLRLAALFRVPGSVEDLHLTSLSPEKEPT
jgi:hypothetical protein